ncbi:MAG: glycoside hydrolase family 3 N-terminal domain-containing protein [Pseudomonadota bacterium]
MIVRSLLAAAALVAIGGCATRHALPFAAPVIAPQTVEARAAAIVARMSLERKVSQLVMPDIASITAADVAAYRFGTILNGGNSGPGGDDKAAAPEWLKLADAMWDASMQPLPDGEPVVPLLWATDAVHGHNNVPGATLFPHNVGLGATRDVELVRKIGEATAAEIAVTGIDWTFAPTIAVATDTRWGRAYESYAQDPALVTALGKAMVEGLQGTKGSATFLDDRHVIATIKHFFGDGGTGGKDQGDVAGPLPEIEAVHAAPYPASIDAGAQSVMASFSSINGVKMHGSRELLTGLLRDAMKFDGVTVGDWNGHGQIPGCTNIVCPQALMAGLDIYMVPEDWKALHANLVAGARAGTIPMARIDEAAARVIAMKLRAGTFDRPRPSARSLAGKWDVIGSAAHRDVARAAVRQSLVLLKNDNVLPIKASANILVAGKAADSIAAQSGGWSITWQGGGDLTNANFPGATSIFAGIAAAARDGGGNATLSSDGKFTRKPDVAVVVFGEPPYAEFMGDRLDHRLDDEEGLALLKRFRAQGIRTVAVLLSGRPLWMNREIAAADAFVAAWLPGSEGQGVADILVADGSGRPRHDFTGMLPFVWPADCAAGSPALFAYGQGGSYARPPQLPALRATCARTAGAPANRTLFLRGPASGVSLIARDGGGEQMLARWTGNSPGGAVKVTPFDLGAQEDARTFSWTAPADLLVRFGGSAGPTGSVELVFALVAAPGGAVTLTGACKDCKPVSIDSTLRLASDKGLRTARIPLACLSDRAVEGMTIRAEAPVSLRLKSLRIVSQSGPSSCQGPF